LLKPEDLVKTRVQEMNAVAAMLFGLRRVRLRRISI